MRFVVTSVFSCRIGHLTVARPMSFGKCWRVAVRTFATPAFVFMILSLFGMQNLKNGIKSELLYLAISLFPTVLIDRAWMLIFCDRLVSTDCR
jgi:hypothetical protein